MSNRICIVEDDEAIGISLKEFLENEGYQVDLFENGELALEKLRRCESLPGVIILDMMMPGMNGVQFRQAQEDDPRLASIPIVVMTADANAESKKYLVGAKALIKKPMRIQEILNVLQSINVTP